MPQLGFVYPQKPQGGYVASVLHTLALTLSSVLPHSDSCGGSRAGIRRVNNYRVPPPGHAPKERPLKDREGAESEE